MCFPGLSPRRIDQQFLFYARMRGGIPMPGDRFADAAPQVEPPLTIRRDRIGGSGYGPGQICQPYPFPCPFPILFPGAQAIDIAVKGAKPNACGITSDPLAAEKVEITLMASGDGLGPGRTGPGGQFEPSRVHLFEIQSKAPGSRWPGQTFIAARHDQ